MRTKALKETLPQKKDTRAISVYFVPRLGGRKYGVFYEVVT